ncbi:FHA domain-containing protein DDL [Auxenochlorella protothecoides]|uniref:FHA domain-containing protein DDL n=1 Tax=Auxenochlorella protothecoides TaxID=3075 RepID=A0A087SMA6_AUXPR|nr:FHA domain-containing protein DDL [Auxenochlorella protothecoides]KFM26860.1 FHA domain-containing protein DDL [Auxenochlorella protothecoides]
MPGHLTPHSALWQEELPDKEVKPDFGLSGALAAETNTVNGVVLLYQEPPEASMPTQQWRLYTFKSGEPHGKPLFLHRRTEKEGADGMMVAAVRPYLMDLGSTNGTFLNGERLDDKRFYELLEQDMIRTGNSSREYVLLHDKSGGR